MATNAMPECPGRVIAVDRCRNLVAVEWLHSNTWTNEHPADLHLAFRPRMDKTP